MRFSKYALFSVILLLLCVAYAGGAERKEFTASVDKDGVQRVEILGGSYFYDPTYIIVKVNVPVELKIRKESGITPHNFILQAPEAGMNINVDLGTDATLVAFTPTKIGTYPFFCDKKLPFMASHRERGMEGVLEVRE
jgi:plastocyanin domain-containing protein